MADEREGGTGTATRGASTRVPWVVIVVLALLLGVGAAVLGNKKTKRGGHEGDRAVLVPTDDAARTVIVPPCNTGAPIERNTATLTKTQGVTVVQLPQGTGVRVVEVPPCSASPTAQTRGSNLPSSLFVLRVGAPAPLLGKTNELNSVQSQLVLPNNSSARTVIVPQCTATGGQKASNAGNAKTAGQGESIVLTPQTPGADSALGPPC